MSDEGIQVEVEGSPSPRGRKEPTLKELEAAAEKAAADAAFWQQERARAFRERDAANRDYAATVAGAWESERQRAEEARRQALEWGDVERQLEAEKNLRNAETQLQRAQYYQAQINSRPVSTGHAVEDLARTLTPKSAAFLRQNSELARDERSVARLRAAHFDAQSRGIPVESDQYFQSVRDYCSDSGDAVQSPRAKAQSQQPNKVTVRLSKEDAARYRETAESLGISFDEYMRRKYLMDRSPEWRRTDELGRTY